MMFSEQTRFKLAIGIIALYFIEGIVKALMPAFPFTEAIAAEGAVCAYYFTVRTINDVKQMKYDAPCPPEEPK
jgi:hypothetical protein